MKFNSLVEQLLESAEEQKVSWKGKPFFDGEREVYATNIYVHDYIDTKNVQDIVITEILRLPPSCIEYWDSITGPAHDMYVEKHKTFGHALRSLEDKYLISDSLNWVDPKGALAIVNALREMFKPYLHLQGEWGFTAFGEHDYLQFGIELDIPNLRKTDILNALQDVDSSDLKDLF